MPVLKMAVDKGRQDHGATEPTEASPLLRPDRSNGADGCAHAAEGGNGTIPGPPTPSSAGEGSVEGLPAGNGGDEVTREGIPEMAKRLHILLPAIGIGIFLCALDQLLAVATVSI